MVAEKYTRESVARKEYPCNKCKGVIKKGQSHFTKVLKYPYHDLHWHSKTEECSQNKP